MAKLYSKSVPILNQTRGVFFLYISAETCMSAWVLDQYEQLVI
jgi:hypothetical protein